MPTKRSRHRVKTTDHKPRRQFWALLLLTVAMLLLIFYSGLRFKSTAMTNGVAWIDGHAGLRFSPNGIAFGNLVAPSPDRSEDGERQLSMVFAVKPGKTSDAHFRFLLLLHGGADDEQLVVGQWRDWLIVMNGDDYDARRRQTRIAVDALQPQKECFVTITSGEDGTAVFIDGQLMKKNSDMHLTVPGAAGRTKLVLGNSNYSRHPWRGEIYGLAIYDHVLTAPVITQDFKQWHRERTFAFAQPRRAASLYLFNEGRGGKVVDHAPGGHHLTIPDKMVILTKEILGAPVIGDEDNSLLLQDMAINFAGFLPMGFLLSALLWHMLHYNHRMRLILVMLLCGTVSLTIELAQAWIPSRSSQVLDLVLNTMGAGVGVVLHRVSQHWLGPPPRGTPPEQQ